MASKVWKDGTRRGIAYIEDRDAARRVIALARGTTKARSRGKTGGADEPSLEEAMAVYTDRRGRPFAWQIPFDIEKWDRVADLVETR